MQSKDEHILISKAKNGDIGAIEVLIEKYQPDVRKFALQVCRTNEDAEDAVQHTLFIVFSKVSSFRSAAKFTSWLFAIVKHECLRLIRTFKKSQELNEEIIDPKALTDERISQLQLEQKLSEFIGNLEPIYREIILLRDIEGLSAPEVADKLGITIEAVKSRLHRARNEIRDQIAPLLQKV